MTKYLSQEWLDRARSLAAAQPARAGATASIQWVVAKGPDGDIAYWWRLEEGHLAESALGKLDEPDITLTLSYEDSVKIQKDELDANAAFMQGKMKVTGDMGKMMALLPVTASAEYKAIQDQVREITEY